MRKLLLLCLLSTLPVWAAPPSTLTTSGVQTVTGAKTFAPSKLCFSGSSSGTACLTAPTVASSSAAIINAALGYTPLANTVAAINTTLTNTTALNDALAAPFVGNTLTYNLTSASLRTAGAAYDIGEFRVAESISSSATVDAEFDGFNFTTMVGPADTKDYAIVIGTGNFAMFYGAGSTDYLYSQYIESWAYGTVNSDMYGSYYNLGIGAGKTANEIIGIGLNIELTGTLTGGAYGFYASATWDRGGAGISNPFMYEGGAGKNWWIDGNTGSSHHEAPIIATSTVTATDFIVGSTSIKPIRCVSGAISGALTLGAVNTGTATCTGARNTMVVACNYTVYPGDLVDAPKCYVSADDTVTVKETGLGVVTPTATTVQVAVIP